MLEQCQISDLCETHRKYTLLRYKACHTHVLTPGAAVIISCVNRVQNSAQCAGSLTGKDRNISAYLCRHLDALDFYSTLYVCTRELTFLLTLLTWLEVTIRARKPSSRAVKLFAIDEHTMKMACEVSQTVVATADWRYLVVSPVPRLDKDGAPYRYVYAFKRMPLLAGSFASCGLCRQRPRCSRGYTTPAAAWWIALQRAAADRSRPAGFTL